jgi:hypothetical protein
MSNITVIIWTGTILSCVSAAIYTVVTYPQASAVFSAVAAVATIATAVVAWVVHSRLTRRYRLSIESFPPGDIDSKVTFEKAMAAIWSSNCLVTCSFGFIELGPLAEGVYADIRTLQRELDHLKFGTSRDAISAVGDSKYALGGPNMDVNRCIPFENKMTAPDQTKTYALAFFPWAYGDTTGYTLTETMAAKAGLGATTNGHQIPLMPVQRDHSWREAKPDVSAISQEISFRVRLRSAVTGKHECVGLDTTNPYWCSECHNTELNQDEMRRLTRILSGSVTDTDVRNYLISCIPDASHPATKHLRKQTSAGGGVQFVTLDQQVADSAIIAGIVNGRIDGLSFMRIGEPPVVIHRTGTIHVSTLFLWVHTIRGTEVCDESLTGQQIKMVAGAVRPHGGIATQIHELAKAIDRRGNPCRPCP